MRTFLCSLILACSAWQRDHQHAINCHVIRVWARWGAMPMRAPTSDRRLRAAPDELIRQATESRDLRLLLFAVFLVRESGPTPLHHVHQLAILATVEIEVGKPPGCLVGVCGMRGGADDGQEQPFSAVRMLVAGKARSTAL